MKAVALLIALTVFSIAVVGWMTYALAEKSLTERVGEQLQIRTVFEKNHLEHDLADRTYDVTFLANENDVVKGYDEVYMCACHSDVTCNSSEHMAKNRLQAYLREYLQYHPSFDRLMLVCPDGEVAISTIGLDEGKTVIEENELGRAAEGAYIFQPEYDVNSQEPVLRFSAPLKNGKETGFLLATASMIELSSQIPLSDMPSTEETYMVTSFRQFITPPAGLASESYRAPISTEASKNCFASGDGSGVYMSYWGGMVMGHYSYVKSIDSCMISEIAMDEVTKPTDDMRNRIVIFTVILSALVAFCGFYMIRGTFRPIDNAVKAVREYGKGNLDYRVPIISDDELGELSKSINGMADEIKSSHLRIAGHTEELEETVKNRTAELEKTVAKGKDARVAMLNMLEDLNDALKKLKSLDVMKDEFMNNAAHELKTPLIPILGYTELALNGKTGRLRKEEREKMVIIERNAKRLKNLVDEILDISKLESNSMKFEMRPMDLAGTIGNSVEDMKPAIEGKGLYLKLNLEARKPVFILGDAKRLTQVVANFISNSAKFTDRGGITVTVSTNKETRMALVKIADTGIGIGEKDMPRLFEKFFQAESAADRKYAGSGLGLSICHGIVTAHGGKIWAESKIGGGSVFSFELPLIKESKKK